jgi:hypothetical protein
VDWDWALRGALQRLEVEGLPLGAFRLLLDLELRQALMMASSLFQWQYPVLPEIL